MENELWHMICTIMDERFVARSPPIIYNSLAIGAQTRDEKKHKNSSLPLSSSLSLSLFLSLASHILACATLSHINNCYIVIPRKEYETWTNSTFTALLYTHMHTHIYIARSVSSCKWESALFSLPPIPSERNVCRWLREKSEGMCDSPPPRESQMPHCR